MTWAGRHRAISLARPENWPARHARHMSGCACAHPHEGLGGPAIFWSRPEHAHAPSVSGTGPLMRPGRAQLQVNWGVCSSIYSILDRRTAYRMEYLLIMHPFFSFWPSINDFLNMYTHSVLIWAVLMKNCAQLCGPVGPVPSTGGPPSSQRQARACLGVPVAPQDLTWVCLGVPCAWGFDDKARPG